MRYLLGAALAGGAMLANAPAMAAAGDFTICDGYPAPTKKIDGLTKGTWLFGLASKSADIRRNQTVLGAAAIPACDTALADPMLVPQYWLRRSHLLQAKATHQLDAGDAEGALKSLAASDNAAPAADPFFQRSVVLGNRALRAVAYFKLGKRAEALAELAAVDHDRPYAAILRQLALSVRLANEPGRDEQRRLIRESARLAPGGFTRLFWSSMLYADYKSAAAAGQEVSFDLPRGRGDWQIAGIEDQKLKAIEKRTEVAGARAYALAAMGQADASRAALAAAEADLSEVMAPLPPLPNGQTYGKSKLAAHNTLVATGQRASGKLDYWKKLIAVRARASTLTIATLRDAVDSSQWETMVVLPDLIGQLKVEPSDVAARDALVKRLYDAVDASMVKESALQTREIVDMLPRPETSSMVPTFQASGDGFFLGDRTGFYTKRDGDTNYLNVRYGGYLSNRATIEELVLLAAAQQARKAGKDSFLIDSRMFVERTVTTYGMYGVNYGSSNDGYEARVRIMPVNAAALAPELEHSRWRLIPVADVEAALRTIYNRPVPAG